MEHVKNTVLAIEDEEYILRILDTLLSASGYRVLRAGTGVEALTLAASHVPDLILLDLGLPDMEGVEVLERLRTITDAPVIVVSARSTDRDKVAALDRGADDYISKPFSAPELLARMRAVARRQNERKGKKDDAYRVGDFEIDFARRSVSVAGESVKLTQIEYRIVELIARRPGKVLTYGYIIEHIWGPYADPDNNRILRVNMSNIRRKIERDSISPKYILTEIGVGYRMAEK